MSQASVEMAKRARAHALNMVHRAKASHIGGALSMIDLLAVLYSEVLPQSSGRVIVSKGHAAVGLYAILAEVGLIDAEELGTYGQNGSQLLGHVSHHIPGIELSTGALGHGLPVACGMALGQPSSSIFVIVGDGEMQEGSNWEALMFAAHHRLENLSLLIDANGIQGCGEVSEILGIDSLAAKLQAFGWEAVEIDGHDHGQILSELKHESNRPKAIIANTIKGKGVDFMENQLDWHYKSPDKDQLEDALHQVMA